MLPNLRVYFHAPKELDIPEQAGEGGLTGLQSLRNNLKTNYLPKYYSFYIYSTLGILFLRGFTDQRGCEKK